MFGVALFGVQLYGVPSFDFDAVTWIEICRDEAAFINVQPQAENMQIIQPAVAAWSNVEPKKIQRVRCNDAP